MTKAKTVSKTAAKSKLSADSSDDEAPPKALATKVKPPAKRKQIRDSDSESNDSGSESDNLMARIRGKTTTAAASKVSV